MTEIVDNVCGHQENAVGFPVTFERRIALDEMEVTILRATLFTDTPMPLHSGSAGIRTCDADCDSWYRCCPSVSEPKDDCVLIVM